MSVLSQLLLFLIAVYLVLFGGSLLRRFAVEIQSSAGGIRTSWILISILAAVVLVGIQFLLHSFRQATLGN